MRRRRDRISARASRARRIARAMFGCKVAPSMNDYQPCGGISFKVNKAVASFWGSRSWAIAARRMVNDEYTKSRTRRHFVSARLV